MRRPVVSIDPLSKSFIRGDIELQLQLQLQLQLLATLI